MVLLLCITLIIIAWLNGFFNEKGRQFATVQSTVGTIEQMTAPPSLYFDSTSTTITYKAGVYIATMFFKPSKTILIGPVVFVAEILSDSQSRILDFILVGLINADISNMIQPDGRMAQFEYLAIGFDYPVIELKLSASAKVKISGNHGLETFILEVK